MKYWILIKDGDSPVYISGRGKYDTDITKAMQFKTENDARSFSIIYNADGFNPVLCLDNDEVDLLAVKK